MSRGGRRARRAAHPERVTELAAAWEDAAWHNTVFPLLEPVAREVRRPSEALSRPVRLLPVPR